LEQAQQIEQATERRRQEKESKQLKQQEGKGIDRNMGNTLKITTNTPEPLFCTQ